MYLRQQTLHQGFDSFEAYNTNPPNGSSYSYCIFVIVIDRNCCTKQMKNLFEVYKLIVTYTSYFIISNSIICKC